MTSGPASEQPRLAEERRFFESDGRPLFGALYPGRRPGAPTAIFCNAFAENHWEWRAMAIAARILSARGISAFVYHPRAHGDSAGDLDSVTFDGLVDDAVNAASYTRAKTGASHLVWIGVRFGALVAASAIGKTSDAAALALWEPALDADDYFRKSMRHVMYYEAAQGDRPAMNVEQMCGHLDRDGKVSLLGFDLHRKFFESARRETLLDALASWRNPTLIAQFQRHSRLSRDHASVRDALVQRGVPVRTALHRGSGGVDPWWKPESIARQTGEWIDGLA